jgi:hypothetical protein
MSKSKMQQKFEAKESLNWFESIEWPKEVEELETEEEKQWKLSAVAEQTKFSDDEIQDRMEGAVLVLEKPSSVYDSDSDDCVLLEDTIEDFPKPMKIQEMAGSSNPGTSPDINNELSQEEIEIADPTTSVILQCSGTRENEKQEDAGPSNSKIVEEELIVGGIQDTYWKESWEISWKVLFEQPTLESLESSITDKQKDIESSQKHPEPGAKDSLEHDEISENPNSVIPKATGSSCSNESSSGLSENKAMEIPTISDVGFSDCLPGPSKPLNSGEENEESSISIESQMKNEGKLSNGSTSGVTKKSVEVIAEDPPATRKMLADRKTDDRKPFECRICQKAFKTKWYKRQHEIQHSAPEARCGVCDKK